MYNTERHQRAREAAVELQSQLGSAITGGATDVASAAIGRDVFTAREMSMTERVVSGGLPFLPGLGKAMGFVARPISRLIGNSAAMRMIKNFSRHMDELADAGATIAPNGAGIDMRWKNLPTEARKAVNDAMTEFGSGADGAKKLLEQVRSRAKPKPSTISDDTLRVYRDFVQNKYDELSKLRQDKIIDVMRDRLEIYRLWLDE